MKVVDAEARDWTLRDSLIGLFLLSIAFSFYVVTLCPTVTWGDPAKLTYYAYIGHLKSYVSHHPLRVLFGLWWGKLPFADYAYGQNLLSAVFASLTILLVYMIARQLNVSRWSAVSSALVLAVSHVFWWLAVVAESYSLMILFFALIVYLLLKWQTASGNGHLYLASFLLGLGLSNHLFLAVFIPAFVYFPIATMGKQILRVKIIGLLTLWFMLGNLFLFYLMTKDSIWTSMNFNPNTSYSFFGLIFGPRWFFLHHPVRTLLDMCKYPSYLIYQFPLWGGILGLIGLRRLVNIDRRIFWFLIIAYLFDVLLASGYIPTRQWELLLPSFLMFSVLIGLGLDTFFEWFEGTNQSSKRLLLSFSRLSPISLRCVVVALLLSTPLALYYAIPEITKTFQIDLLGARSLPNRDNDRYFLLPDKSSYRGALQFAETVFRDAKHNSIVCADFTPLAVLNFLQVNAKRRPDIKLITVDESSSDYSLDFIKRNIERRPIYLVDIDDYQEMYGIRELTLHYDIVLEGILYRIKQKSKTAKNMEKQNG